MLLGRDDLLERFDELIAETLRGRGRTLFLSGQAGLGKTRLLRAAIRKCEAAGLRIDGGSVAPQDMNVPLASIHEMASGMRGNQAWGTLSQDLLAIEGRSAGDALGARRVIVRAAADRILEAIDRPTALFFSDLHWADEMSLEVIGELARHNGDRPLLIAGDYRGDEFPVGTIHREWRARLLSQRYAEEARLRRLTEAETATAISLILGGEMPAPREVVEAVHQRTNGIPLHIEELLAALPDDARSDGHRIREAHVPDTISDAVLARLSRLSEDARLVARAGAVMGRCFTPDALAGVAGRPLAELEPAIQELVDGSMLHPFDYVDQGYYDFRHQLLRDAIYSDVPPSQLRRFHAQAAEFVMTLESSNIIHASRHYERAGMRTQAFRTSLTAAANAGRISARHEAWELYRRAIDNMPDDTPPGERAELYRSFSLAGTAIERLDEAIEAARSARHWFLEAGRVADAAATLVDVAQAERKMGLGSVQGRRDLMAQGLAELEGVPAGQARQEARFELLSFLAIVEQDGANFDEASRLNDEALAIAAALGDGELRLDGEFTRASIALSRGEDDASLERLLDIARRARAAGYESTGVTSFRVAAGMAARNMDYATADAAIGEGYEYADAIEQSHCRQQMAATSALVAWTRGDWDAAVAIARQEIVERGCRRGALSAIPVIGYVAMGRGELDEARRWLADASDEGREIGDVEMFLPPLWGLAEFALVANEPATALARSEEALEFARRTGERPFFVPFVVTGVRAALALHRPEDARRWMETSRAHLAGWRMADAALAHGDGLVALAHGHLSAARESLEAAVEGWQRRERIWEASGARLDLAQVLLRSNRHGEAAVLIARVRETADSLGSRPLQSRAEELQRLARGHGGVEDPWHPLSAREFEVARLVAQGMTNAEIAEQLFVSPKTVSAHIEHMLAKLGVARRAEIAAWATTISRVEVATGPTRAAVAEPATR
ncbi:MAG TPA: LuxR C-terminal-related transcriptional regulator [Candidatus Acidoferrales bacterium]|nr:LuxR C-terminal-related transcriptional regulator [Candidatus Acidoferrales bacterium]